MTETFSARRLCLDQPSSRIELAALLRAGREPAVFYLHGWGCAKEDILPVMEETPLRDRACVTFDFPGFGRSPYPASLRLTLDDWVVIAAEVAAELELASPIVIGHSMGGAAGLLLATRPGFRAGAFVSLEGNLTPENCNYSRRTLDRDLAEFTAGLAEYREKLAATARPGPVGYAATLALADPRALHDAGPSLVRWSDSGDLLLRQLALAIPWLYVFGEENRGFGYLPALGERVAMISRSGHFSQRDNPAALAAAIGNFIQTLV